jgi:multidrug efflux system membrane fusion protein
LTLKLFTQKSYAGPIILILSILLLYAGYRYFAFYNTWTNDVYVSAHVIDVVPQVDGTVVNLYVRENQAVKKGDKLVETDLQTTLYAPVDGLVTNMKVHPGQYVTKGQGLFAIIDTKHWWLVARYRETVLRRIQPGKKVRITIDMYPGKVFRGHVQSVGWGINRQQSGEAAPSPLIYMKPTEYWIKIAQRFPVIIDFEDWPKAYPLRVGASGTTWVDTADIVSMHAMPNEADH